MNWQRFNKVSSFSGETSGIVKKNFIITAALLSSLFLAAGNDSNLLIVFYVQIMPDDFVMQLHRF
ncbi:Conserved putative membrane protein [Klebsiella pneumoniae]|nr:Conserved putative membrane protein [Klebsiella pneumoniae]